MCLSYSDVNAQIDTIGAPPDDSRFYRERGSRFNLKEKTIGIVPSLQGVNHLFVGVGIARGNFTYGEGGANGAGITAAFNYNPIDQVYAPSIDLWAVGFAFIFGGNIGLNTSYYFDGSKRNLVLRPEIGIGIIKLRLNYGYNLFLKDEMNGISRHTLTLSYYFTAYPGKE